MNKNKQIRGGGRRERQKGQALVETALIFMAVLGTVVFILDIGHLTLMENFITERTREAARNAAVNNWTSSQVANYLVYNDPNSTLGNTNNVNGAQPGYMGLTTSEVTTTYEGTAGTPDYRVQVKVSGVSVFPIQLFNEWGLIGTGSFSAPPVVVTVPMQSAGSTS